MITYVTTHKYIHACMEHGGSTCYTLVVSRLFLILYHLWIPYCQHIPSCS